MQISETPTGQVAITANDVTIMLSQADAFELLCWLDERRDALYQRAAHGEPAPARADKDGEPWLEDCEHCGGAHLLGTVDMCPLNANPPQWVLQLREAQRRCEP